MTHDKYDPDDPAAIAVGSVAVDLHADAPALLGFVRWRATALGERPRRPTAHIRIPINGRHETAKE